MYHPREVHNMATDRPKNTKNSRIKTINTGT
uniref:Uncharacterized protein n=1 Tax=Rhizophora mucronata TaxID=61149 RepID=A0A2P2QZU0_RHIMU